MRIAMFTNTYTPFIGGVARSVDNFVQGYRRQGHEVLVVTVEYDSTPADEMNVLRVPAITHFNGTPFSMALPLPAELSARLDRFRPEIIHSHHPFMIGAMALRESQARRLPLVFTVHTMYEHYTHYVGRLSLLKRLASGLTVSYANLCASVIAPSRSVQEILAARGVQTPIRVIPTGIDWQMFATGNGRAFRDKLRIPQDSFALGYVGRLAPEKNLVFLARAAALALQKLPNAFMIIAGEGPSRRTMSRVFNAAGVMSRIRYAGSQTGRQLVDAYHAMDVFVFSSVSETQGMVLAEALATGTPVIALDAPGARDVIADGVNGRLIHREDAEVYSNAIIDMAEMPVAMRRAFGAAALDRAREFDSTISIESALSLYREIMSGWDKGITAIGASDWETMVGSVKGEWQLWSNRLAALFRAASEA